LNYDKFIHFCSVQTIWHYKMIITFNREKNPIAEGY